MAEKRLDAYDDIGTLAADDQLVGWQQSSSSAKNLTPAQMVSFALANGLSIGSDVQAHSTTLDNTTASYTTAEETKLSGVEPGAEVNTVTPGNVLNFTNKTINTGLNPFVIGSNLDFLTYSASNMYDLGVVNNITVGGTVDGRDVATDGAKTDASQYQTTYVVGSSGADYITDGTADDVQIQAAIDAANTAGGGTVFLKEGTFDIAAKIDLKDNVDLVGASSSHFGSATVLLASAAIDMIEWSSTLPGGIANLKIDGGSTATSGIRFTKDALDKIKGARLNDIVIEDCITGIEMTSTGISSGPADDMTWKNVRIRNCTLGLRAFSVSTVFLGGLIGGCDTGVELGTSSGSKFQGTVFTTNDVDFDAADNNFFNLAVDNSYFEATSTAHFIRAGESSDTAFTSAKFSYCSFLNNIAPANPAFDFQYATGTALFDFCRFSGDGSDSKRIKTNAATTVYINGLQTATVPVEEGSGDYIYMGDVTGPTSSTDNAVARFNGTDGDTIQQASQVTIDDNGTIRTTAMAANGRGYEGYSGGTHVMSLMRQSTPSNASVGLSTFGGLGIATGATSGPSTSYDMSINTSGDVTIAGDTLILATSNTPASASAAGVTGQIAWDSSFIYICTATNTWKRVAIATW